jgi:hypothetical protein
VRLKREERLAGLGWAGWAAFTGWLALWAGLVQCNGTSRQAKVKFKKKVHAEKPSLLAETRRPQAKTGREIPEALHRICEIAARWKG